MDKGLKRTRSLKASTQHYASSSGYLIPQMRDRIKRQKSRASTADLHLDQTLVQPRSKPCSAITLIGKKAIGPNTTVKATTSINSTQQVNLDQVDIASIYALEICRLNLITVCGNGKYVIPDFDKLKRSILEQKYVLIVRTPHICVDSVDWLYTCTCTSNVFGSMRRLSTVIKGSCNELRREFPPCIHISALQPFLAKTDALEDMSIEDYIVDDCVDGPLEFEGVFPMVQDEQFCVITSKDFAVVTAGKCSKCQFPKCDHLKETSGICDREPILAAKRSLVKPKSTHCIPYSTPDNLKEANCKGFPLDNAGQELVLDGIRMCNECDEVAVGTQTHNIVKLYTATKIVNCKVEQQHCKRCDMPVLYDGYNNGILNMGKFLISHLILRSYLHRFKHGNCPLDTFYQSWTDDMSECGYPDFQREFTYQNFIAAWYGYLDLLDIDYGSGFMCPVCQDEPKILLCDGTSLAFRKSMLAQGDSSLINEKEEKVHPEISASDRQFISCKEARKHVKDYADLNIRQENISQMLALLEKCGASALCNLIKNIEKSKEKMHTAYVCFLKALSTPSPVSALLYLSSDILAVLEKMITSNPNIRASPSDWRVLNQGFPLLANLMVRLEVESLPEDLLQVCKELICPMTFHCSNEMVETTYLKASPEESLCFFPQLPCVRNRGLYKPDLQNLKKREHCKKTRKGHKSLLPGIFTIYCEHGICYGFQVMQMSESPNIPFTIFKTRFKQVPSLIVYDNACMLELYSIKRDPVLFHRTKFCCDRIHWNNHTACSEGYNLSNFSQFDHLNTEINEQINAGLKRIKGSVSYMNQSNFMKHCILFLWLRNKSKLNKM